MSSDDNKKHVLIILNQLTSYVENVLKSYILNEILLVAISILKSSLPYPNLTRHHTRCWIPVFAPSPTGLQCSLALLCGGLRALSSLRGLRGAPEVPPLYRETAVSRTANVGTVGMNGGAQESERRLQQDIANVSSSAVHKIFLWFSDWKTVELNDQRDDEACIDFCHLYKCPMFCIYDVVMDSFTCLYYGTYIKIIPDYHNPDYNS